MKKARKPQPKRTKVGERGLPTWPRGKPLPKFKTHEEEVKWWDSYDLESSEAGWEAVEYVPRSTQRARTHVYRIRFDDLEMAKLQVLAKRRGVPVSVILRELVRAQ